MSVSTVGEIILPIIGIPIRCMTSEPTPPLHKIGSSPAIMAATVIIWARTRSTAPPLGQYRRVLWVALAANLIMFLIEVGAGLAAGSVSLQADALDFFGDAANYAISLFVLGMTLRTRASAALLKAASMALFGLRVIGTAVVHAIAGTLPEPTVMSVVGRSGECRRGCDAMALA